MSAVATRDMILAIDDLKNEDVEVPEWGVTVRVREMTGAERGKFEKAISKVSTAPDGSTNVEMDAQNMRVQLCAMTIIDEEGKRLFSDNELGLLGAKSAKAIQRVFDVAARLSGISDESVEEEMEKSQADQTEEQS